MTEQNDDKKNKRITSILEIVSAVVPLVGILLGFLYYQFYLAKDKATVLPTSTMLVIQLTPVPSPSMNSTQSVTTEPQLSSMTPGGTLTVFSTPVTLAPTSLANFTTAVLTFTPTFTPTASPTISVSSTIECNRIYIVIQDDTLLKIARRYETTQDDILRVNPTLKNPNLIHPGDKICLP